ncbi:MAG: caspase family protein [Hyphomonadaceae bacterium]
MLQSGGISGEANPNAAPTPGLLTDPSREIRLALVIGIENYERPVNPLTWPHEDAESIALALRAAGFTVTVRNDLDKARMREEDQTFAADLAKAGPNGVGFLYFSGHGGSVATQEIRRNYLLPAGASVATASQLALSGIRTSEIVDDLLIANAKAVFIVIDACRNTLADDKSIDGVSDKGLVRVSASDGIFMAFAAADGETAPDDGVYARELAKAIRTEGISHDRVFTLANRAVAQTRPSGKYPITSEGLRQDIFFRGLPSEPASPARADAGLGPFTYLPPGWLYNEDGAYDATVYAPDIAFPIEDGPAFVNSMLYTDGGAVRGGDQCSPRNFVYPWVDNFCEARPSGPVAHNCQSGGGHGGVDIRAGDASTCAAMRRSPSAERTQIPVIAVEDGVISNIGMYSIQLKSSAGGRDYRYLHLNMQKLAVTPGQTVKKGDRIGYLSNDNCDTPTAMHLHFEILVNLEGKGWTRVSPYMSLVRAYERDRGLTGLPLMSFRARGIPADVLVEGDSADQDIP